MRNNKKKYNRKSCRNNRAGTPPKYIKLTILPNDYYTHSVDPKDLQVTTKIEPYSINDILVNPDLKSYKNTIIRSNRRLAQNLNNDFNKDFPRLCLIQIKDPKSTDCIVARHDLINKPLGTLELSDSRPDDVYIICTVKCILECKVLSGSPMEPILYTNLEPDNVTIRQLISSCQDMDVLTTSIKTIIKKDGKTLFPRILKDIHGYSSTQLEELHTSIAPINYNASSKIDDILEHEEFYTMKKHNGTPIKHISIDLVFTDNPDIPTTRESYRSYLTRRLRRTPRKSLNAGKRSYPRFKKQYSKKKLRGAGEWKWCPCGKRTPSPINKPPTFTESTRKNPILLSPDFKKHLNENNTRKQYCPSDKKNK